MKAFDILEAKTLSEAIENLPGGAEDTRPRASMPLAGGQDLLTEFKHGLEAPGTVVDLAGIPGLDEIEIAPTGVVTIGAMVTLARIARHPDLADYLPVVTEAAESVGSPQIRSQGTLGGNLCQRPRCWYYRNPNASCLKKGGRECLAQEGLSKYNAILGGGPSYIVHPSDMAPALVCLKAEIEVTGLDGARWVPSEDFFTLPNQGDVTRENVLRANELVTRVRIPSHGGPMRSTYLKFQERGSYDFALASVALAVHMRNPKTIASAHLCFGGLAPIPWRVQAAENVMNGKLLDDGTARLAAEQALAGARPLNHNAYKVPLATGLLRKAVAKLADV